MFSVGLYDLGLVAPLADISSCDDECCVDCTLGELSDNLVEKQGDAFCLLVYNDVWVAASQDNLPSAFAVACVRATYWQGSCGRDVIDCVTSPFECLIEI